MSHFLSVVQHTTESSVSSPVQSPKPRSSVSCKVQFRCWAIPTVVHFASCLPWHHCCCVTNPVTGTHKKKNKKQKNPCVGPREYIEQQSVLAPNQKRDSPFCPWGTYLLYLSISSHSYHHHHDAMILG